MEQGLKRSAEDRVAHKVFNRAIGPVDKLLTRAIELQLRAESKDIRYWQGYIDALRVVLDYFKEHQDFYAGKRKKG